MAREKGTPKTGGRKKGVKNKRPPMKSLRDSLADLEFDLGAELVNLYKTAADDHLKHNILKTITQYTQTIPKEESPEDPQDHEETKLAESKDSATLLAMIKNP